MIHTWAGSLYMWTNLPSPSVGLISYYLVEINLKMPAFPRRVSIRKHQPLQEADFGLEMVSGVLLMGKGGRQDMVGLYTH